MATLQSSAADALQTFNLQDAEEVRNFIREHPHLLPILEEAPRRIAEFFGDAPLSLAVEHDPEESYVALTLFIHTTLEMQTARAKLKAFDATWWLAHLRPAQGDLCITLEFE